MTSTLANSFDEPEVLCSVRNEGEALVERSVFLLYLTTAFLIGVLNQFTVQLVGQMPVNEILLGGILLHALAWVALTRRMPAPLPAPGWLTILIICQIVGLAGYVVSDLWRGSHSGDMIRGWSRMLFLAIDIGGFGLLFGASNRAFAAVQIGIVLSFGDALVHGPLFGDYWKFGFAFPITTLILLIAPRFLGYWGAIVACLALTLVHSVLDFRSLGGICVCVAGMLAVRLIPPLARKWILLGMAVILIGLLPWGIRRTFGDTAERAARSNVERAAMLQAAWEGFARSPFVGNGSWFSNSDVMDQFLIIRMQNARLAGVGGFAEDDAEGMAIHSQILVALAEGGVFGAAFFFAYGVFLLWGIWFCLADAPWDWLVPIRLFVLLTSFWNLLMSPFSGTHRVEIAMAVGLLLILWRQRSQIRNFIPPQPSLDQCLA